MTSATRLNTTQLDADLSVLTANKVRWANTDRLQEVALLLGARIRLRNVASKWVDLVAERRGFARDSPDAGVEWLTGPFALANAINGYLDSLRVVISGKPSPLSFKMGSDGVTRVSLFDSSLADRIQAQGMRGTAWTNAKPGETPGNIGSAIDMSHSGRVALVLGAGNVNSIPPLDVLHKLIACREVVLLKLNPVNAFMLEHFNEIFSEFISDGFLRITTGDASVGSYLTAHDSVETVHITGSLRSHDAIVFGDDSDSASHRTPKLTKPISSELGGINAVVVVPGPWSARDLKYQADHIVTSKLNNVGFNCVASQILVLPEQWSKSATLLDLVRSGIKNASTRTAYYPSASERVEQVIDRHPNAECLNEISLATVVDNLNSDDDSEPLFKEEVFAALLGVTRLHGTSTGNYIKKVIDFCNDSLHGTLGITILIHPRTIKDEPDAYRALLTELRYGTIGINVWNSAAYALTKCPWGAYPGHTLDDIQSGNGQVHNTWMIGGITKTILEGHFIPAPRSLLSSSPSVWPSYAWFVDDPRCLNFGIAASNYATAPSTRKLIKAVGRAI